METFGIIAIIVGIAIMIALCGLSYASGLFDSSPSPGSCKASSTPAPTAVPTPPPFVPKYRLNKFSCKEPVNIPGSVIRGTVEKCEASCDNILACVGFDRRSDVPDDKEAFCYLQMSNCCEADADKKLSPEQDGDKWKRHIKPR